MAAESITIGRSVVGPSHPPFVIAELSANHQGSLEHALETVDAVAAAGARALKLQTYTADTLTIDSDRDDFLVHGGPWDGRTLYNLYSEGSMPWEWHAPIMKRCAQHGIECFSTPFDESAVEFLDELGTPAFKIASFEITHVLLLRAVARTGRPVIVSTGMATLAEIDEAVTVLRDNGCEDLMLLACTSTYPADPADSDLLTIPDLHERFECLVGLSDHTLGTTVAIAAVALGAVAVEKHVTLNRADGGVDAGFSAEPAELRELVSGCETAWRALGSATYGPSDAERGSVEFRRSVYFVRDVAAGQVITAEDVRIIRPGFGLAPKHIDDLVGMKAVSDIERGTPARWELVG